MENKGIYLGAVDVLKEKKIFQIKCYIMVAILGLLLCQALN